MASLVCVPLQVQSIDQALADADLARLHGCDLVEYRLDSFFIGRDDADDDDSASSGDESDAIERLIAASPVPCIATCRIRAQGGAFDGSEQALIRLYERLIRSDVPPRYLDIEFTAWQRSPAMRSAITTALAQSSASRDLSTTLILSTHDFDARPADLSRQLIAMRNEPAAGVIKIAYRARSLRDNLDLFEVLAQRDRPTIALGMGAFGLLSRVLSGKFGGLLTFAALDHDHTTAPGQPTIAELTDLYRFATIGPTTRVYGVVGWPVGQSLGPAIHNAGFDFIGHNGIYLPLPIPPGRTNQDALTSLKATLGSLIDDPRLDLAGVSVTIPHKENLVRLAARSGWTIDPLAEAAGAGNTLVIERDDAGTPTRITVLNTDADAARSCLEDVLGSLKGTTIAIIGAGGVARAIAAGCGLAGARIVVLNRSHERAQNLVSEMAARGIDQIEACTLDNLASIGADVFVNATPIGMVGGPDPAAVAIPLDASFVSAGETVVFDTVYMPVRTPMMVMAEQLGLRRIDGLEMFVRQAATQFFAWTGRDAPAELFERIVREQTGPHNEA